MLFVRHSEDPEKHNYQALLIYKEFYKERTNSRYQDLFGRGYSDAPTRVDYDDGLYISQIMFVVSSSDLDWTTFSLIGYSLGGGIVSSFASYFPKMVESLVVLATSGLLR